MDLREAIELLKKDNNQLIETDILVEILNETDKMMEELLNG